MTRLVLTGKTFGELKVIGPVRQPNPALHKNTYWRCRCSCGAERIVMGPMLARGSVLSCGCRGSLKVGEKHGCMTVIGIERRRVYRCKCDCGRHWTLRQSRLTYRPPRFCAHCDPRATRHRNGKLKNLTGRRFGAWRVLGRARGTRLISWRCRCRCGTERVIYGAALLRKGRTRSCGCGGRKPVDLTGARTGKLTVVGRSGRSWRIKCDCGRTFRLSASGWRGSRYGRQSCGKCPRYRAPLLGKKFGELTVIRDMLITKHGGREVLVRCSCGTVRRLPMDRARKAGSCGRCERGYVLNGVRFQSIQELARATGITKQKLKYRLRYIRVQGGGGTVLTVTRGVLVGLGRPVGRPAHKETP